MAKITDDQRAEVLKLHAQGHARNEISRRVGISAGSVTNICRASDRTFDRSETKQATEARKVDLAAGRTRLAEKMLLLAVHAAPRSGITVIVGRTIATVHQNVFVLFQNTF